MILELKQISKSFGSVKAINETSLKSMRVKFLL